VASAASPGAVAGGIIVGSAGYPDGGVSSRPPTKDAIAFAVLIAFLIAPPAGPVRASAWRSGYDAPNRWQARDDAAGRSGHPAGRGRCPSLLLIHGNYSLRLVNLALIFALLSVSLNVVLGYAGQIAHRPCGAVRHRRLHLVADHRRRQRRACSGRPSSRREDHRTGRAGLGVPTLRLKGHYLALATLGFGEIMRLIFFKLA